MSVDLKYVDEAVERVGREPEAVIPILQALQGHYGYLPEPALRRVCDSTDITPAGIAGVASFYDMFRHKPAGKFMVRVCRGTACHVTGAERVEDALRRQLDIAPGEDTDRNGLFSIEPVACLGCCTLAPVVKMGKSTFGHATAEKVPKLVASYLAQNGDGHGHSTEELDDGDQRLYQIKIGLGSCCMAKGSDQLYHALKQTVAETGVNVTVKRVGCVGMCHRTPLIEVAGSGQAGDGT